METDQNSAISETVIEALRARSRRYDVAIDDDLVLSVLPNGAKTWTWVYDDPANPHRKTLGIYPDMTLEDARKSLAAEKQSYSRAGSQEAEFEIRDGRIQPVSPSSQLPIIAGAAVAMIAVAAVAFLLLRDDNNSAPGETVMDDSSPFVTTPTQTEVQLPTITPSAAEDIDSAETNVTGNTGRETGVAADFGTPVTTPSTDATVDAAAVADDTPSQDSGSLATKLDRSLSATSQPQPVETVDTSSPDDTVATQSNPQIRNDTAIGTLIEDASTDLIVDSRVARGVLTTAVNGREPVDDLGTSIVGTGEELQTYYFFTELRSLSGQRVRHRWLHRDRVVAEVPFNVGEAWRWRVYSSKTFIPSMTGQWQIQVLLDDDTVIHNQPFSYNP